MPGHIKIMVHDVIQSRWSARIIFTFTDPTQLGGIAHN